MSRLAWTGWNLPERLLRLGDDDPILAGRLSLAADTPANPERPYACKSGKITPDGDAFDGAIDIRGYVVGDVAYTDARWKTTSVRWRDGLAITHNVHMYTRGQVVASRRVKLATRSRLNTRETKTGPNAWVF